MLDRLIQRDLHHVWHPCSDMKDFETDPPLIIHQAQGCLLETNQGPMIDATSSWWCKSLGHRHPAVIAAIQAQLHTFEHVIGAGTTCAARVELSEKLAELTQKQHLFFASDGSCAVEIALKLAIQAQQINGQSHRSQFIALHQGYHGETLGALSVSDLGQYKQPFNALALPCHFLKNIPYVSGVDDPLWSNCDPIWPLIEQQLQPLVEHACAIIVEPILQGAGGMHCYSADFLQRLALFAKQHGIYFIADEIMTGIGRTGRWLASEHAQIQPDMICLSKGLTSGSLPLSCVAIDHTLYELFYHATRPEHAFLHSHTYTGNPLAVSAALATLTAIETEQLIPHQVNHLGASMRHAMMSIATKTQRLTHIRSIGAMVAADLIPDDQPRLGYRLAKAARQRGALLRPLGNTLYWLPPLNTTDQTIEQLAEITATAIESLSS